MSVITKVKIIQFIDTLQISCFNGLIKKLQVTTPYLTVVGPNL